MMLPTVAMLKFKNCRIHVALYMRGPKKVVIISMHNSCQDARISLEPNLFSRLKPMCHALHVEDFKEISAMLFGQ
jgi:hypothetical protein